LQLPGQILHLLLEIAGEVANARRESGSRGGGFGEWCLVIGRVGQGKDHLDLPLAAAAEDRHGHRPGLAELDERGELISVADDLVVETGENVEAFQAGAGGRAPRFDRIDKQADALGEIDLLADGIRDRREGRSEAAGATGLPACPGIGGNLVAATVVDVIERPPWRAL
jgi:hypothetical protein